jgi:nucleoside-diphosphate-sugar epimerase
MMVLITGAAGFVGKECVAQFKAAGYGVLTTDKTGAVDLLGDLADPQFSASLPEVDIVVHCAAVQYVTQGVPLIRRQRFFRRNNVDATRNLCARYRTPQTHFIHVGTSMMYKQTGAAIYDIDSPMGGEGVYSRSKMQAQAFVNELPGAATVIPCIIGGEGREGLFRGFVTLMKRFGVVVYPGAGTHPVHMVHVRDVAGLIVLIAQKRASGWFNAAAPAPLSISQWVDEIADELKLGKVRKVSLPLGPLALLSALLGYRLLAREQLLMLRLPHVLSIGSSLRLGWQPEFSNARIARDIARHIAREIG